MLSAAAAGAAPAGIMPKARYYGNMVYDGCRHLYHGCILLGRNTKLATRIMVRVHKGQAITRRERLLLEKATVDLLRLVPFSVFIIVPFGEALLPVALKMFPGLIPSTFETESQGRNRAFGTEMTRVRARTKLLEHATTQVIAAQGDAVDHDVLRRGLSGDRVHKKDIRKVARHFNTLAPLGWDRIKQQPRVLKNMAGALGVQQTWHSLLPVAYLGGPLSRTVRAQLDKLHRDDDQLRKEGLAMLTRDELEAANHMRGMRWVDDDAALVRQLQNWIDLGEDADVPYHALVFIRPTAHTLHESIRSLPADTRKKLMGIMAGELPPHVAENLEELMVKIEKHGDDELDNSADTPDDIADRAKRTKSDSSVLDTELTSPEVLVALQKWLKATDVERLYDDICLEHGEVTVTHLIKVLCKHTRASSHTISTVFDALDFPDHAKPVSLKTFRRLLNRLADSDTMDVQPPKEKSE
jgi:LETM1 and EF-hand domain-containing protein 1